MFERLHKVEIWRSEISNWMNLSNVLYYDIRLIFVRKAVNRIIVISKVPLPVIRFSMGFDRVMHTCAKRDQVIQ